MWKFQLARNADGILFVYILIFSAIGIALVYAVDAIYKRVKRKSK